MQNRKNPFSSTPAIYRNAKQKRPAKKKNTAAAGKIKFNEGDRVIVDTARGTDGFP